MGKTKKAKSEAEALRVLLFRAEFIEDDPNAEEDKLKYETIVDYCRENNIQFHDGEFPHIPKSYMTLGEDWKKNGKKGFKRLKKFIFPNKTWVHPEKTPDLKDMDGYFNLSRVNEYAVFQHYLGNCGLVAAVSAVSADRSILETIFEKPCNHKYGVYQVRLCVSGIWKTVIVDDAIPMIKNLILGMTSAELNFAQIVEKALAKERGSYGSLIQNRSLDALATLTGAPCLQYNPRKDGFWEVLTNASYQMWPMTCSTYPRDKDNQGLSPRHAYTLIETFETNGHQLVRIRCPSGTTYWKGKWSKNGNEIRNIKSIRVKQYLEKATSIDCLEFSDFQRIFQLVKICRYRPTWTVIRAKMGFGDSWNNTQKDVLVSIARSCTLCVSILEKDSNRNSCFSWITVYQVNQEDPGSVGEIVISEMIMDFSKDISLTAGHYIINFYPVLNPGIFVEQNVAIHCSEPFSAKFRDWNPHSTTLAIQKAVEEWGRELLSLSERNDISIKKYSIANFQSFIVIMATNYNPTQYLHVHMKCTEVRKWTMSRTESFDEQEYADVIPPRSRQISMVAYQYLPEKEDFPIKFDYWFSKEKLTKIGRSNRAAHIPSVDSWEYVHHTTSIN